DPGVPSWRRRSQPVDGELDRGRAGPGARAMSKVARLDDPAALPAVGVTLLLALAVCSPGSNHEPSVSELVLDSASMQIKDLERLLWPKQAEHWRPPSEQQQAALDSLVTVLLGHARRGEMSK